MSLALEPSKNVFKPNAANTPLVSSPKVNSSRGSVEVSSKCPSADSLSVTENPDQPDPAPPKSFAKLWLQNQHAIGGFVCVHVPDHHLADDIIQEVAELAAEKFEQYDQSRPFSDRSQVRASMTFTFQMKNIRDASLSE